MQGVIVTTSQATSGGRGGAYIYAGCLVSKVAKNTWKQPPEFGKVPIRIESSFGGKTETKTGNGGEEGKRQGGYLPLCGKVGYASLNFRGHKTPPVSRFLPVRSLAESVLVGLQSTSTCVSALRNFERKRYEQGIVSSRSIISFFFCPPEYWPGEQSLASPGIIRLSVQYFP